MTSLPVRRLRAVETPDHDPAAGGRRPGSAPSRASAPYPGSAPDADLGLRERKKLMTRHSIAEAAFSLAMEHGVDGVTIEDIATRAVVSPRTVSNYFPSKEAAIISSEGGLPPGLLDALAQRPADESPLEALGAVLAAAVREQPQEVLELVRAKQALVDQYPALLPHRMAQYDAFEDEIRGALAVRLGVDADADADDRPYPRLVAGAAVSALKTAIRLWVQQGGDGEALASLVQESLRQFDQGLPDNG